MKYRSIALMTMICCLSLLVEAQAQYIDVLEQLAKSLSVTKGHKQNWQKAVSTLSDPTQPQVALLDNLEVTAATSASEYHKGDADPFRLNGAVNRAYDARRGVSTSKGDFYNSLTFGINYSMIEKTVAPNATVSYTLKGHYGPQTFAVVAYNPQAVTADISTPNAKTTKKSNDKTSRFAIADVKKSDVITITVTNKTGKPQAFVIINHNSKK